MVRSITGTLIDVGRGRLPAGTVRRLLASGRRVDAGTTAPAHGLTLMAVRYGNGAS
jgi:tRNA pseudouridine38-40 synthase